MKKNLEYQILESLYTRHLGFELGINKNYGITLPLKIPKLLLSKCLGLKDSMFEITINYGKNAPPLYSQIKKTLAKGLIRG